MFKSLLRLLYKKGSLCTGMRSGGPKKSESILWVFFPGKSLGGPEGSRPKMHPMIPASSSHSCVVTSILNRADLATKGYCSNDCVWLLRSQKMLWLPPCSLSRITHSGKSCQNLRAFSVALQRCSHVARTWALLPTGTVPADPPGPGRPFDDCGPTNLDCNSETPRARSTQRGCSQILDPQKLCEMLDVSCLL